MQIIDVVAAIIVREGRLLLAQRPATGDQPGLWEFPGGKVESGESQPAALARELSEELAIEARVGAYVASHTREVSGRVIRLHAWRVEDFDGERRRCVIARWRGASARGVRLCARPGGYSSAGGVYVRTRRHTSGFVLRVFSSRWHCNSTPSALITAPSE